MPIATDAASSTAGAISDERCAVAAAAAGPEAISFTPSTDGYPEALSALIEADNAGHDIEARCSVAKALLSAIQERHSMQVDSRQDLEDRSLDLHEKVDHADQRIIMLAEAETASTHRLELTRKLLVEGGRRLEGLRVRGAVAE